MSLWSKMRDKLRPPPARLRNKPMGMAWIKGCNGHAAALNGRVVQTVRHEGGFWTLEPIQHYVVRLPMDLNGMHFPGIAAEVLALHDDLLEPIRDVGDQERDESAAWLPPVPTHEKAREHA